MMSPFTRPWFRRRETTVDAKDAVGVAVAVVTVGGGLATWMRSMVMRERERNDALYQTKEACAKRDADVRAEFGLLLVDIRDTLTRLDERVARLLHEEVKP